jgi:phospholipid-binding lipoprotein MlaA
LPRLALGFLIETAMWGGYRRNRVGYPLLRASPNWVLIAGVLAGLAGCAAPPPGAEINDPYEQVNRQVHDFNIGVDRNFLRPAGQVAAAAPVFVTGPVVNFSNNVSLPGTVVNNVLQGDIGGTVTNTVRFLLNSTVGVLGLFDPAGAIGITEVKTDFGETLAVWGVGEGPYVELPLLGPSTARDALGQVVDFALDPLSQVGLQQQIDYGTYARIGEKIIDRGQFGDTLDSILYDSADSYAQARLIYLQNRRFELGEAATDAYIDPYAE